MAGRDAVSVVIVHHGDPAMTRRSIRAARASRDIEVRICVVRNAPLGEGDLEGAILLGDGTNRGFAAGANEGIRDALAGGAGAVLLLNNDAEPDPCAIAELASALRSTPGAGAAGAVILSAGRIWHAGGDIESPGARPRSFHHGEPEGAVPPGDPGDVPFASGCALLVARDAWEGVGLFDERYFLYFEDADLCFRIRRAGRRVLIAPRARVVHAPRAEPPPPEILYYRIRNRLLFSRIWFGSRGLPSRAAFALREVARGTGGIARGDAARGLARWRAVLDFARGRFGPRRLKSPRIN
ncbi:MAG: glycosyltransferase family 2 protein [Planctomycetes bacterium]|nr:glycosyltransferase family 2 protein [Planctomycetota bacterium]